MSGSYKIGSQTNCSADHPNISLTLYIAQKFNVEKEDLTNETFEVEVVAMGDDEYTIDYIEGEEYVFHGSIGTTKYWADAESHCNDQNGHLVSIHTNYENDLFQQFQRRYNKGGHKVWLGGSDSRIEGIWEWSDGSFFADVSATTCNSVKDVQKYGLQKCANWAKQQPAGGTRRNCLAVDGTRQWVSDFCEGKSLRYWCHITPKKLTGRKRFFWKLADIPFSKLKLSFTKKPVEGSMTCNSTSGILVTWSTNSQDMGQAVEKPSVPDVLDEEELDYIGMKVNFAFRYLTSLRYTILSCKKVDMTTEEIWTMVRVHKLELVENNQVSCDLGQVKRDDYAKLISYLRKKIPKDRQNVAYNETDGDYALAVDVLSYLLYCEREQMEMAAFYNNLFQMESPRTILQATVNNIQSGVKGANTMLALRQIYKLLAKKMNLQLPYILQGFFDSKMQDRAAQDDDIFMIDYTEDNLKNTTGLRQGKNQFTYLLS